MNFKFQSRARTVRNVTCPCCICVPNVDYRPLSPCAPPSPFPARTHTHTQPPTHTAHVFPFLHALCDLIFLLLIAACFATRALPPSASLRQHACATSAGADHLGGALPHVHVLLVLLLPDPRVRMPCMWGVVLHGFVTFFAAGKTAVRTGQLNITVAALCARC